MSRCSVKCLLVLFFIVFVLLLQVLLSVSFILRQVLSQPDVSASNIFPLIIQVLTWLLQGCEFSKLIFDISVNFPNVENAIKTSLKKLCTFRHLGKHIFSLLFFLATVLIALCIIAVATYNAQSKVDMLAVGTEFLLSQTTLYELLRLANLTVDLFLLALVTIFALNNVSDWDDENNAEPLAPTVPAALNTLKYFKAYHEKGLATRNIRNALQSWFVLHYLVYLLFIFQSSVLLAEPHILSTKNSTISLVLIIVYLVYDILQLLLPYLLGLWMIKAHRAYYKDMTRKHLLLDIVIIKRVQDNVLQESYRKRRGHSDSTRGNAKTQPISGDERNIEDCATYTQPISGKSRSSSVVDKGAIHVIPQARDRSENTPSRQESLQSATSTDNDLSVEQFDYLAEVYMQRIELCNDYDFYPRVLDVSIPLDSPGYSLSILLAVFAVIVGVLH